MEKNTNIWQKVLTIFFVVLSFLFVLLLMLFMFNNTIGENFATEVQGNKVVRILVIVMSVLYFANAIVLCFVNFYTKSTLDAIEVMNPDGSSTKISRGSIISVVKHNIKFVDGVQVKGVNILQDSKNKLRLSVHIRIMSVPVEQVVTPFRVILFKAFSECMGVEFDSIDFVVTALKPKYTPDMEAVEQETNALRAKKEHLKAKKQKVTNVGELKEADKLAEETNARKLEIERLLNETLDEKQEDPTEIIEKSPEDVAKEPMPNDEDARVQDEAQEITATEDAEEEVYD